MFVFAFVIPCVCIHSLVFAFAASHSCLHLQSLAFAVPRVRVCVRIHNWPLAFVVFTTAPSLALTCVGYI
jgi:hypothetical protein